MYHVRQLDGIRAIAVLIVVTAHVGLERYVPGGFGVTIFFFLSGYLITSLLRSEFTKAGVINIQGFYIRRFFRINPPLWITLIVGAVLVSSGLIYRSLEPSMVAAQFFFYINYVASPEDTHGIPITSLWSLAVEEHFYLLFPLLFGKFLARLPANRAVAILFCACAVTLAIRVANVFLLPDFSVNYYWTHTRIDSILFGCCLAVWQNPILDRGHCYIPTIPHVSVALIVIAGCLVVRNEIFRQTLRYTLQGGALFVLFSYALQTKSIISGILSSRPLRVIGNLSYTMYLCQGTVFILMGEYFTSLPKLAFGCVSFTIILCYATLMYYLVERPIFIVRRYGLSTLLENIPGTGFTNRRV